MIHDEPPRLTAALLIRMAPVICTTARSSIPRAAYMDLLNRRDPGRPTLSEMERAERVLDLTL